MRLEPTPRPDHTLRVSARLITSSTILHLSSDELERAVTQEQMENPALDVSEKRVCLFCGSPLQGPLCANCGHFEQPMQHGFSTGDTQQDEHEQQWSEYHSYDIYDYRFNEYDDEDELDLVAHIAVDQTLADTLMQQLNTLLAPEDALIAEQLVGNLNERGYLEISIEEIADYLQVSIERVAFALRQLQTLEPMGIGARNLRECLLIQLETLAEQELPHPLAYVLIDRHLEQLGKSHFLEIARELNVPEQEVRQAAQYIRGNLNPFPAHTYQSGTDKGTIAAYARPDILIRRGAGGFEVELIEEKRYGFHIGPGYGTQPLRLEDDPGYHEIQRYIRHQSDRAKFFIDCIQRRWRTLKQVAELIVDYQREFLDKGVRYLRPFTRAEVATRLNLDESTVSRATANKYALLPNGRLIPLSDFFDGSLGVKDILRELISTEDTKHRLSDDELARLLTIRGIPMARRTVTKYREEIGIGSSRERGS
ncbi:MAG: RNA polymerase factor sigma-54 [Ktedonobacteraceae bacterium]